MSYVDGKVLLWRFVYIIIITLSWTFLHHVVLDLLSFSLRIAQKITELSPFINFQKNAKRYHDHYKRFLTKFTNERIMAKKWSVGLTFVFSFFPSFSLPGVPVRIYRTHLEVRDPIWGDYCVIVWEFVIPTLKFLFIFKMFKRIAFSDWVSSGGGLMVYGWILFCSMFCRHLRVVSSAEVTHRWRRNVEQKRISHSLRPSSPDNRDI